MWVRANPAAIELAREIRAQGMRTAILSNIPIDLLNEVRGAFDWLDEFEVQIWSCDHGVIKPYPEIYRICLEQTRLPAPARRCSSTTAHATWKAHEP